MNEKKSENKSKWRVFWEENWLTIAVVLVIAGAYVFLRTPGDAFASIDEVETQLMDGQPTVIEFYSNSCSICLVSKPKVDQLEADLEGQADLLRLNVKTDVGGALAGRWGVRGVPTFFVFDGSGDVVYAQAGAPDAEAIREAVHRVSDS
jgi:thioredoxin-like negative regulator of GroEL